MEELTPQFLQDAITTLRAATRLHQEAGNVATAVGQQLTGLGERFDDLDLGVYLQTVATLSRLRGYMVRTDRSLLDDETEAGSICEEDEILRALLPDDPVVYVDVGADQPKRRSNTWQFWKAGGRGLLIEPRSSQWYPLMRYRPRDHLWPTGVADFDGVGQIRIENGASSLARNWKIQAGAPEEIIEVCHFQRVLDRFPAIRDSCQLCSIDVEGFERRVLRAIDWTRFRPRVLCVEHITFDPFDSSASNDQSQEWAHLLTDQGYEEHARTAQNVIYTREPQSPPTPGTQADPAKGLAFPLSTSPEPAQQ